MKLEAPTQDYNVSYETERNRLIEESDNFNHKKRQNLEIAFGEKLILSSPNGTRYSVSVNNSGAIVVASI